MTATAAKRRKILSLAVVCLAASLLLAPSAEATRGLPASLGPRLELPVVIPPASTAEPSFSLLTDEERFLFAALSSLQEDQLAQVLERRRFRPLGGVVSPELTSGLSANQARYISLGSGDLGWKSHQGDYFLEPDPLGPVDSPNLYQAFGFDGMNVTDPYGECWTGGCIETLKSAAGYVVGLGLSGAELVAAPVTMAATETVDAYNNVARVTSAYQAGGVEAAWSEADMIGREETEENKQRLIGMIPFVNTYRQGSQVIRTYEEQGSFAGGMRVGRTAFSLGTDVTVVYGAASGARAVTRPSPSSGASSTAPRVNLLKQGVPEKVYYKRKVVDGRVYEQRPTASATESSWVRPNRFPEAPSLHGNRLGAPGPHDVYAVVESGTGRVLRFGETGRGHLTRLREWQRYFLKQNLDVDILLIDTVKGKASARAFESRLIRRYERAYGSLPRFQRSYH
jgi:hypothetical protein